MTILLKAMAALALTITLMAAASAQTLDQQLFASDASSFDNFGNAVAIDGSVVVVGAPGHDVAGVQQQGAAYVYLAPPTGWSGAPQVGEEVVKLIASDGQRDDSLGNAVAVHGPVIAVASRRRPTDAGNRVGAVYIYVEPPGGWLAVSAQPLTENALLLVNGGEFADLLGWKVAIKDDVVIASAPGVDDEVGAIYVFERPKNGWQGVINESARLEGRFAQTNFRTGQALGFDGQTVVAGTGPFTANRSFSIAYVFERPVGGWSGVINESAFLQPPAVEPSLGREGIAVNGDLVAVGVPEFDEPGAGRAGAVYLFQRPPTGWQDTVFPSARLHESLPIENGEFGGVIDIAGDQIFVGRAFSTLADDGNVGSAYLFQKPGSGWFGDLTEDLIFLAEGGMADDDFGQSLATDGNTLIIGAPRVDKSLIATTVGSAYVADLTSLDPPLFADGFEQ